MLVYQRIIKRWSDWQSKHKKVTVWEAVFWFSTLFSGKRNPCNKILQQRKTRKSKNSKKTKNHFKRFWSFLIVVVIFGRQLRE